jgi:hypothetical protein
MSTKAPPITPLVSILINNKCIGYLIRRGRTGFEAFDAGDKSLQLLSPSKQETANAVHI